MKKIVALLLTLVLLAGTALSLASCGEKKIVVAIPNDTTNEARALLLLEAEGLITLDKKAGITATVRDIVSNPYGIEFREVEAAQLPRVLSDVDFAVINSNYAIEAGINPAADALGVEGSFSAYANILAVKSGYENDPRTKALVAALSSERVKNFIQNKYNGAVLSVVDNPGDGYDATVDYDALKGTVIRVAASATPHAEILEEAKAILAARGVTLQITVYTDYVQPNTAVESGAEFANYFQHTPYLDDFNKENGTHIVSVLPVHVEPMGIYSKTHTTLDDIRK